MIKPQWDYSSPVLYWVTNDLYVIISVTQVGQELGKAVCVSSAIRSKSLVLHVYIFQTSGTPLLFHRKKWQVVCICHINRLFNNDSSLPTFATNVPTCAGHFRIVPVLIFLVETKNTVFMTYPMHNWAPYWLFTMVYACIPHFNLWRGHKHLCSFQLRIYSSKSEIDKTLRGDSHGLTWSLTSSPARAHSIIAKHNKYFLQIVDYFAVLC